MSTSVGAGGSSIAIVATDYCGASDSISVSSCTMGGCLGGSPGCVGLMKGWDNM